MTACLGLPVLFKAAIGTSTSTLVGTDERRSSCSAFDGEIRHLSEWPGLVVDS